MESYDSMLELSAGASVNEDYVSSCGIWAGQRPPVGSSQAERSVINEG